MCKSSANEKLGYVEDTGFGRWKGIHVKGRYFFLKV